MSRQCEWRSVCVCKSSVANIAARGVLIPSFCHGMKPNTPNTAYWQMRGEMGTFRELKVLKLKITGPWTTIFIFQEEP